MRINRRHFFIRSRWIVFNDRSYSINGRADRRSRPQERRFMAVLQSAGQRTRLQQTSIRNTTVLALVAATCLSAAAFASATKEYRYTVGPHANISVDTQY